MSARLFTFSFLTSILLLFSGSNPCQGQPLSTGEAKQYLKLFQKQAILSEREFHKADSLITNKGQIPLSKSYFLHLVASVYLTDEFELEFDRAKKEVINSSQIRPFIKKLRKTGFVPDSIIDFSLAAYKKERSQIKPADDSYLIYAQNTGVELYLKKLIEEVYKNEVNAKGYLLSEAQKWRKAEIISSQSHNNILSQINKWDLQNVNEFLPYINPRIRLDKKLLECRNTDTFKAIIMQIASAIPQFDMADLRVSIIQEKREEPGLTTLYEYTLLKVDFNSNGRHYMVKEILSTNNPSLSLEYPDLTRIFFRALTDSKSPYRLCNIEPKEWPYRYQYSQDTFYYIAPLTPEQYNILNYRGKVPKKPTYVASPWPNYLLSSLNFDTTYTSEYINAVIKGLDNIGLLSHLPSTVIDSVRNELLQRDIQTTEEVFICFPEMIYFSYLEGSYSDKPYIRLVKQLNHISHNRFMPIDIVDNYEVKWDSLTTHLRTPPVSQLTFSLNGHAYSFEMDNSDGLDHRVFTYINSALEQEQIEGRFYTLPPDEEDYIPVIFLTAPQYNYLVQHKLLDLSAK